MWQIEIGADQRPPLWASVAMRLIEIPVGLISQRQNRFRRDDDIPKDRIRSGGRAICCDRRRRSFRIRHHDRRQRGGVPSGAGRRGALTVVAHHRPCRWTVLEQGDRVCPCACVDRGRRVALVAARRTAQDRHLAPGGLASRPPLWVHLTILPRMMAKKTVALGRL
jgi:hypothetical protein